MRGWGPEDNVAPTHNAKGGRMEWSGSDATNKQRDKMEEPGRVIECQRT